jgi:hypothetical protein
MPPGSSQPNESGTKQYRHIMSTRSVLVVQDSGDGHMVKLDDMVLKALYAGRGPSPVMVDTLR